MEAAQKPLQFRHSPAAFLFVMYKSGDTFDGLNLWPKKLLNFIVGNTDKRGTEKRLHSEIRHKQGSGFFCRLYDQAETGNVILGIV